MSKLVTDLKSDHQALLGLLEKVTNLKIPRKERVETLMGAKNALLGHLKKESDHLYPALKKFAAQDPKLKATLDTFATEMEGVSKLAIEFFAKHTAANEVQSDEFAKDLGKLIILLKQRISREEAIVYQEYDKRAA